MDPEAKRDPLYAETRSPSGRRVEDEPAPEFFRRARETLDRHAREGAPLRFAWSALEARVRFAPNELVPEVVDLFRELERRLDGAAREAVRDYWATRLLEYEAALRRQQAQGT